MTEVERNALFIDRVDNEVNSDLSAAILEMFGNRFTLAEIRVTLRQAADIAAEVEQL